MLQVAMGTTTTVATVEKASRCQASQGLLGRQRVEAVASVSRSQNRQALEVHTSWKLMPLAPMDSMDQRQNFLPEAGHVSVRWARNRPWCCRFADL